ncbi:hypothetical protein SIAM614_03690 [Roseibium aggregatum IAM 12614]|uniref:Uncharacterized protein n=1 Tax=Roseibium aggregatum (strain ATCC 25650 / DSM 13394 / JCM 20685 / NBRC 16684 / NCIMB 2208 / IAM 12614 / B1) TaxID=384765 RepID=A0NRT2_ROSAI|nr:hypothetical protein [Roseibium aggregatum]EAV44230.1 hypothetical protein SIAM614_03690 [Roseibium aggregatum IAM 12614]
MKNIETGLLVLTSEIATEEGLLLHKRLRSNIDVGEPNWYVRKSADPSAGEQFIQLIGSAKVWLPLTGAATAFFAAIGKRAGDALWDRIAAALNQKEARPLAEVSEALASAVEKHGNCELIVGLPLPNEHFGTVLIISDHDPNKIAYKLGKFSLNVGELTTEMTRVIEIGEAPWGRAVISIEGDDLVVRWKSQRDYSDREFRIQGD